MKPVFWAEPTGVIKLPLHGIMLDFQEFTIFKEEEVLMKVVKHVEEDKYVSKPPANSKKLRTFYSIKGCIKRKVNKLLSDAYLQVIKDYSKTHPTYEHKQKAAKLASDLVKARMARELTDSCKGKVTMKALLEAANERHSS